MEIKCDGILFLICAAPILGVALWVVVWMIFEEQRLKIIRDKKERWRQQVLEKLKLAQEKRS